MSTVRYKLINEKVESLLAEQKVESAPVKIEKIIDSLGIHRAVNTHASVSGAAIIEGTKRVIIVNAREDHKRQRFTMAHELGHILLHGEQSLNVDTEAVMHFRDFRSKQGESAKEIEANFFAANILMPATLIQDELDSMGIGIGLTDDVIIALAKRFDVSEMAMGIRLGALGWA